MPLFITSEMRDLQRQLVGAEEEFNKLSAASETTQEELDEAAKRVSELREQFESMKRQNMADFINKVGNSLSTNLSNGFSSVKRIVESSIESNNAYFQSLNRIVGINGQLGELGTTLRNLASGVVGKQDLATFFGNTGDIIAGADAMSQQAEFARDLIAAYGSAETAAQKYRNIVLLSIEDQQTIISLVARQAEIVESSSAGQIQSIRTSVSEALSSIGQSILYSVKPIVDFIGQVANAFRELSGISALDDQTAALERNLNLTEEEKRVLEELNEIERLQASGFTSSLDEVHEIGNAYIEATEENDEIIESEKEKQEAMSETENRATAIAEALYSIVEITQEVGEVFSSVFEIIGPGLLNIISWIASAVSGFVQWADSVGVLKPLLVSLISIIAAVKAAQLALAAVNAVTALTSIAATGPAALVTAGIVAAAVGIGAGVMAGVGINSASSSSSSVQSTATNNYSGTQNESGNSQVTVYLDGKKVNDALANEDYFNTEVTIT